MHLLMVERLAKFTAQPENILILNLSVCDVLSWLNLLANIKPSVSLLAS